MGLFGEPGKDHTKYLHTCMTKRPLFLFSFGQTGLYDLANVCAAKMR